LLSPQRTAIVIGKENGALRDLPQANAHISWRVQPGVVGVIDECEKGYCRFETNGRYGYIETARIWGDEAL
jgi:SH3-like domain-containing protein